MDDEEPQTLRPRPIALPERLDGRGVVAGCAVDPAGQVRRQQAHGQSPPRSTLFGYLDLWSYDGTLDCIHHALFMACREQGERDASPTAAIIDSQSVKSAEKGGRTSIHLGSTQAS